MRPSCIQCGMKHLGQAAVLYHETKKGYPHHIIYAVGHLAEAEDELVKDFPAWTERIRKLRIALMENEEVDFDEIMNDYYIFYQAQVGE